MGLGIDFGGSFCDAVVLEKDKVVFSHSVPTKDFSADALQKALSDGGFSFEKAFVTGRAKEVPFLEMVPVDEMTAIGRGAVHLSHHADFVTASVGTGTALVAVSGDDFFHLGGTGVGGGTLEGLSNLLLKSSVLSVHQLALHSNESMDLTVADVVGAEVGLLSQDATASNFGGECNKFYVIIINPFCISFF
jgi:type II pantothenate kinase